MTDENKAPKWFMVVATVALVWNILGVVAFINHITMTAEMIAKLPDEEQALYASSPIWATASYALAVVAGTLGCALLLMKKVLANTFFVCSLLGVLLHDYYSFFMIDTFAVYGASIVILPLIVLTIAIALILFTSKAQQKKWIT